MANNNPTVKLTWSSGGSATYTKVEEGSGWKITVTAVPNSGRMVSFIRQTCDRGNDRTVKYNYEGTITFVSAGHSDCSEITIYVSFVSHSDVQCEYEYWAEVDPPEAGTPRPLELESKIIWVTPGGSASMSFGLSQNAGWENYEIERRSSDGAYDVIEYDPPRTGASLSNSATVKDGCDPDWPLYHWFYYKYKCRRRTFTVTFDPNGGSVDPTSKTVTYGLPYGDLPVPTKNGHGSPEPGLLLYDGRLHFDGWYTSRTGGEPVTKDSPYLKTANQTLYAHWSDSTGPLIHGSGGSLLYA